MTKGFEHHSFLDFLRPDPGWETDLAVCATYTADPVVLVACLLALSGVDHDEGSGSKIDFATAHENLAGKVKFMLQAGQLMQPAKQPAILGILDGYLAEVRVDEHHGSWHPKLALIRYRRNIDDATTWRFWMGSRNLTRDMSYDMGLSLQSSDQGYEIEGLADSCIRILSHCGIRVPDPDSLSEEIHKLKWLGPEGCRVKSIHHWNAGEGIGFPKPPSQLEEVMVISPFLDGNTLREFMQWGDESTHRLLLSSPMDLTKLSFRKGNPFEAFHNDVFYLDSPSFDPEELDVEEEISRGLHAKIIGCKCRDKNIIWMGSPNMTQRAWKHGNAECSAKLQVEDEVYLQLKEFVSAGIPFESHLVEEEESDPDQEALEEAHKSLTAQWQVTLTFSESPPTLKAEGWRKVLSPLVGLRVGLLSGEQVTWPESATQVELPPVKPYEMTKLLRLTLSCGEKSLSWVQSASAVAGVAADRDRQMMAHYLSPAVFMQWLKSLLLPEVIADGGGDWDEEPQSIQRRMASSVITEVVEHWAPSLEEILRAWNREPGALTVADQKVRMYARYLEEQNADSAEQKAFEEFRTTWRMIVEHLQPEGAHG